MAPVTRRRTKALEQASQTDSSIISDAEGDSLTNTPSQSQKSQESTPKTTKPNARSKRKSTDAASAAGGEDESSKLETPKRKRLAVRTRVEESPKGDHRRVHIEATVVDSAEPAARQETVADSDDEEKSDAGAPEPESATRQLQEEAIQKLVSQSAEPETAGDNQSTPTATAKGKHVVFGDDDDVNNFVAEAAAKDTRKEAGNEDEDEDNSDDEAPEAVSTAAAAKQSKKAEQAAVDAAEKLAATQKRKRQERDALFREQAAERKRAEAEAKAALPARGRINKRDLPDILPAEFLEDSDSEDSDGAAAPDSHMRKLKKKRKLAEAEAEAALAASAAKKIRFDEVADAAERAEAETLRERRRPRDVMMGSTVYRVLAQQGDQRLAPKMHKNSRAVKEDLLKRKRDAFATSKKKGFFVKK